ncbi:MAG: hypothetical protein FWG91_07430 [Lachnospiraceae bacterium]|nr:hypothetical protein [Lachnospiraceae bacterium]
MKKIIAVLLTLTMTFSFGLIVLAKGSYPIIDDTVDYSSLRIPVITYEGDFIIESFELSDEEIELGKKLQDFHVHPAMTRHFSLIAHSHSIRDIKDGTAKQYVWNPSSIWVRNSLYPNESSWPAVSWTQSQSTTASATVSTSVGVDNSVVSTSVGASFTTSHTISTSTTITFTVPYQRDGRIKVNYYRPYKTFTCVTKYVDGLGGSATTWEETGPGNAIGTPYNIVATLELKTY